MRGRGRRPSCAEGLDPKMDPLCHVGACASWDAALVEEADRLERELRTDPGDPRVRARVREAVARSFALCLCAWSSTGVPWEEVVRADAGAGEGSA